MVQENAALSEKAAANSENRIKQQLEVGKLQSKVRELRRFMDSIPLEVTKQLKSMQRQQRGKER